MRALTTLTLDSTPYVAPAPFPVTSRDHVDLIGAPDAMRASYADISAIPVPEDTYRKSGNVSYRSVPYADLADATRSIFAEALDAAPLSESYATACNGQQMFGKIVFPWDETRGLAIALRSSYNRSIANQLAGGLNTYVCANGCFSGEAMVSLKHTLNVGDRLPAMIREMAERAATSTRAMAKRLDGWSDVEMGDDLFYAYLGILIGRGIVTPTIGNTARAYWKACRSGNLHDAHGTPTLASAFQAVTGGLQRVAPLRAFHSYGGVDHVTDGVAQSGGSMTGIPQFTLDIEEYQ